MELQFETKKEEPVVESENNHLLEVVKNSGLNEEKSMILVSKFEDYTKVVDEWKRKSKELIITDVGQKTEMKMCREAYLLIKSKVVDIEKTRKSLKEDSLKEGRAIDEVAKELKLLLEPLRDELKEKSEFADRAEEARKEQLKTDRLALLEPFGTDTTFIPLGDLSDEDWNTLFEKEQTFFNFKKEQAEKAEQERIAKEKQDELDRIEAKKKADEEEQLRKEEEERIRAENEKLKKEAEEKEKVLQAERLKAEAEKKAIAEKAEAERKQREIEAEKLRKKQEEMIRKQDEENQIKLKAERDAREKLEKEISDKKAKEEAEQKRLADEAKAKADVEKKALKAPDKDKLLAFSKQIEAMIIPVMKTEDGQAIANEISTKRQLFAQWIVKQAETL